MVIEYDDMKEEIKNLKTYRVYQELKSICKTTLSCCLRYRKSSESKSPKVARKRYGIIMILSWYAVCNS